MKTILLPLLIAALAGCATVGPDYQRGEVAAPDHWCEPVADSQAAAATPVTEWWHTFNDPELDSLIERAIRSNHDLRIAQARVREARAQYGVAEADGGPTVDAAGSAVREQASHHQPVLGSLPLPPGIPFDNNVYQAGFDASWEIDVFGGTRREREAALAEVQAAEYGRRAALVTLLGEVARNYLDVRGSQRRLEIAEGNIAIQEQSLAISRERVAHGLTSDVDVELAATLLATTRAGIPPIESALRTSIHRLGILIGQPPGALLAELSVPAPIPAALPIVPIGLPSDLLLRRPDIQRAERAVAAVTARIGVARADLFPRFFLTGGAGFESISADDWFTKSSSMWSVGPSISWRIFDMGRVRANIKVMDARLEQAQAAYEQTILTAFEDVENALVAYAKEQVRHRSLTDAVASSRASLVLANQLYVTGLKDSLTVLDAERSLLQSQDQLVQSERAVSADLIALYKALGGGWQTRDAEHTAPIAYEMR
jgi:outer membrane protein, multidrug efflux system